LSSFLRSSRRAQRQESLEMGLGPSGDSTINLVASVFGGDLLAVEDQVQLRPGKGISLLF
jgi:hypothetical protein